MYEPINNYPHEQLTPEILESLAMIYKMRVNPIRATVRGMYDLQFERIKLGQRIMAQKKVQLGGEPGKKEEDTIIEDEDQEVLDVMRTEYRKMMDGVKNVRLSNFKAGASPLISTLAEFCMMQTYMLLEADELHCKKQLDQVLRDFPIYTEYLSKITGIGVSMAGVIISEINIVKAPYVSSLWKYAGLSVEKDNRGTSRRKEHQTVHKYINREGEEKERLGVEHNTFLKSKLTFVMSGCLIKAKNPRYRAIYDNYKTRMENHAVHGVQNDGQKVQLHDRDGNLCVYQDPGEEVKKHYMKQDLDRIGQPLMIFVSKGHRHRMAIRYMVKMFLQDLYPVWRRLENLPVALPYAEAKLGRPPHRGGEPPVLAAEGKA